MNPYTGDPSNDPATVQVLEDNDLWIAGNYDTPVETIADSVAYLRSRTNNASTNWRNGLTSWNGVISSGSWTLGALQFPPVWDSAYQRWLASFEYSEAGQGSIVAQSFDGKNWLQAGVQSLATSGIVGVNLGCVSRPTDGAFILPYVQTGPSASVTTLWTEPAGQTQSVATQPWTAPGSGHWYSGAWCTPGNIWVVWQGGSTNSPWYSPDANTWTSATSWAAPSGFTIHDRAHFSGILSGVWFAIIFPAGTSVTSACMYTSDGKNWIQAGCGMPTLGSGESVIDAAYDQFTSTLYLLTGTSAVTHVWASASLGAWTLQATLNRQAWALRANGRELLMWISFPGVGLPNYADLNPEGRPLGFPAYGPVVSTNRGVSWSAPLPLRTTTAPSGVFALRTSGAQFLYAGASEYSASMVVGAPPPCVV